MKERLEIIELSKTWHYCNTTSPYDTYSRCKLPTKTKLTIMFYERLQYIYTDTILSVSLAKCTEQNLSLLFQSHSHTEVFFCTLFRGSIIVTYHIDVFVPVVAKHTSIILEFLALVSLPNCILPSFNLSDMIIIYLIVAVTSAVFNPSALQIGMLNRLVTISCIYNCKFDVF